jgi:hypothetical protein
MEWTYQLRVTTADGATRKVDVILQLVYQVMICCTELSGSCRHVSRTSYQSVWPLTLQKLGCVPATEFTLTKLS